MKTLILAAGSPQHVAGEGYPLILQEFNGEPLIQLLVGELKGQREPNITFLFRGEDVKKFNLNRIVELLRINANVISVDSPTAGAACTALLAIDEIDPEEELLILNGDELIGSNIADVLLNLRSSAADAGVICFDSIHPRYSYVSVDEGGWVMEAAEKNPISNHATMGFYWFRRGRDFLSAVSQMLHNRDAVDRTYYVCPSLNYLILNGLRVKAIQSSNADYHPLKSSAQISQFVTSSRIHEGI